MSDLYDNRHELETEIYKYLKPNKRYTQDLIVLANLLSKWESVNAEILLKESK